MRELNSQLVRSNGHWERQTWFSGSQEGVGEVVDGWSGEETFVRRLVIKPIVIFNVVDFEEQARLGEISHPMIAERGINGTSRT